MSNVPIFVIIGQSNEGKSSIVSTLVGHDQVRVEHNAGTTREHNVFPVEIDGKKVMNFIDTPGFEHPKKILKWLRKHEADHATSKELFSAFYDIHHKKDNLKYDCELLFPIKDNKDACLLYVFNGSRPIDQEDLWAMEIIRMSGCGRIALINCREDDNSYLQKWKNECNKFFSSTKIFNAHTATFKDRIQLLKNMGVLVQDLYDPLELVIKTLENQRERLYNEVAEEINVTLLNCITFYVQKSSSDDTKILKQKLIISYKKSIEKIENDFREKIKKIYRHKKFDVNLPMKSIINKDLFSEETWTVFGLPKDLLTAAAASIGGLGLALALAPLTGGASLIAGIVGAATAGTITHLKSEEMIDVYVGKKQQVTIGPNKKEQFYYILVDRMILYYSYMVNRAHGKRVETNIKINDGEKQGFTAQWPEERLKKFQKWLSDSIKKKETDQSLEEILVPVLKEIDGKIS